MENHKNITPLHEYISPIYLSYIFICFP